MIIDGVGYCNLLELERDAYPRIDASALGYLKSGAESEETLRKNRRQFDSWSFVPRCLVDVSDATTSCRILGRESSMPVMIAPMAMQKLAHAEGELGMAKGGKASGVPMILSTMSTIPLERVADCGHSELYFQLYCLKDRDVTRRMIQNASRLGYRGIIITVDAPVLGKRESDEKTRFQLPEELELEILAQHGAQVERKTRGAGSGLCSSKFGADFGSLIDDSLTWDVVKFCRSLTNLPIILKGILSKEDAKLAVKHGVSAIVVSNHGGRQLDHCVGTLEVLEDVCLAVRKRCEVWVDGGFRRGTDVVKALALGADAVLVGRPMLWALALGGAHGVEAALNELQSDILRTIKLLGCRTMLELKQKGKQVLFSAR
jgi:isopentenyl diphosphate isomerase/L-lactate dehydrogenase-like FMN-dependent dehydrogenase